MKFEVLFTLVLLTLFGVSPFHGRPPNIVVILADDQGWGDLSVNGNSNLSTPHIDSLANQGATLENFYVCQVCAPTRSEFLTGRYYPRTGVSGVSRGQGRLNPDEATIADFFKKEGYATGAFGKWHNGTQPPLHPNDRGFDEYYGFTSGHWGHYFSPPLDHNGTIVRGNGYVVDDFTDHAIAFIEQHQEQPFFCYVPYNTPHSPMMISDEFYEKFAHLNPAQRHRDPDREDLLMTRAALAMCENIDWNVGRILSKLDELDLEQDTIVLYFSDNGPNSYRWNGDMKGRKGAIDEGGLRSPFFIRWPQRIPSGIRITPIAGAIDLLPTLLDLAGIAPTFKKPIDGKSLRPLLLNTNSDWNPRILFAIKGNSVSVRSERFRLDNSGALFDIENDRGQRIDVSGQHPEIAAQLASLAQAHEKEMRADFERFADRPFTVGYGPNTLLPARDGIEHGAIQRSSKAPNNSFFTHWTSENDFITWDVDVGVDANYAVTVKYTCAAENVGLTLRLSSDGGDFTEAKVVEAFDPPLYDKSKERVPESHYFVKDFKPLLLGEISLPQGRTTLKLSSRDLKGPQAVDVHSIALERISQP